jgi:hypothetical protein
MGSVGRRGVVHWRLILFVSVVEQAAIYSLHRDADTVIHLLSFLSQRLLELTWRPPSC